MKIKIACALMASASLLTLGSCSEGRYWNEPDSYGDVVAFPKPAENIVLAAGTQIPSSYDVIVYRSEASAEQTFNIALDTSTPDVISGPATVTFPAGSNTATYTIAISDALPGVQYTATVEVDEEDGFVHVADDNSKFTLRLFQNLVWNEAGTASVTSCDWVIDGDENPVSVSGVKVEEAVWPVAGERLFRLVNVYNALEPQYADPGASIAFFTDDAGNALRMYQEWQYIGETYDDELVMFGCPDIYGGSFTNEGSDYEMSGVLGTAVDEYSDVDPLTYETLQFVWTCPPAK